MILTGLAGWLAKQESLGTCNACTHLRVALPSSRSPMRISSNNLRDSLIGRSRQGLAVRASLHWHTKAIVAAGTRPSKTGFRAVLCTHRDLDISSAVWWHT